MNTRLIPIEQRNLKRRHCPYAIIWRVKLWKRPMGGCIMPKKKRKKKKKGYRINTTSSDIIVHGYNNIRYTSHQYNMEKKR